MTPAACLSLMASAVALTCLLTAAPASATPLTHTPARPSNPAASGSSAPAPFDKRAVHAALEAAVGDSVVGVQARVSGRDARWAGTAGSAEAGRTRPVPREGRFRIGSITKTFVATVVLQLVAEGRIGLDRPIQEYLPDALPADYPPITVRHLLQHTSGIPNYRPEVMSDPEEVLRHRWRQWHPGELVAVATAHPRLFEPGTAQSYGNTNYILLGMLIQDATGRTWEQEVTRRLIKPLGLTATSAPDRDPHIPGPHAHGYMTAGGRLVDITVVNPSAVDAAGAMISSTRDLNTFLGALLTGAVLPPPLLAEMLRPFPGGTVGIAGYGLGVMTLTLPPECGGETLYGHGGGTFGFSSLALATRDARRLAISTNTTAFDDANSPLPKLLAITQAAYCGPATSPPAGTGSSNRPPLAPA
ncbi:serine hydrolase domain-containing protein [Thermocatellispora tengchongensis]